MTLSINCSILFQWHRRFRPMNIIVMVTDKPKADIIGITTSRAFGECTRFQPGCSISSTNSYKLFWFSSGSMHPCHTEKTGNYDQGIPQLKTKGQPAKKRHRTQTLTHNSKSTIKWASSQQNLPEVSDKSRHKPVSSATETC